MVNGARKCEGCHALEARGEFWEIWKSQLVELRIVHRTRRVGFRGSLRPDEFVRSGRRTRLGADKKSQNRKNVYLSPYVEEPLNSKVIKNFVPELRSRKCFSCFEIPMYIYIYIYIYEHYERFAYRYEYIHFTYSYLAMVH